MASYMLKNSHLTVELQSQGAELTSIYDQNTDTQYLWNGDPAFWNRHSPILFPFVGLLKDKTYSYQGQSYPSKQHGFARDMEFKLTKETADEIWFSLTASPESRMIYPFDFQLELGYRLTGRKLKCFWKVTNLGDATMYFSIGGHPGFYCPLDPTKEQSDYYFAFDTDKVIQYLQVDENAYVSRKLHKLTTDHGILPIATHMFDYDALIIEDNQCHKVSLLDPSKKPYLSVSFHAPLFGLWSPAKKNAPFVCIEPWYGRSDACDFNGNLEEREYGNSLEAGQIFTSDYTIEILA